MKYYKIVLLSFLVITIISAQEEITKQPLGKEVNQYRLNKNLQILKINSDKMLDSVITMTNGAYKKHTMTYNSKGAVTSKLTQSISNNLNNLELLTYEYDDNGRITLLLSQRWDSGEWVNVFRQTITYDGSVTDLSQQWDAGSNSWANYMRKLISSDAPRVTLGQIWDWSLNDWKDDWRETKEYDGEDLIYSIYENWIEDEWKIQSRVKYTFDTRDNLVRESSELWTGEDWWLYYKYEYAMRDGVGPDNNDRDTTYVTSYKYQSYAHTLVNDERQTCIYDEDEYLSYCFNEIYDRNGGWRDGYASIKFTDLFDNEFTFSGFWIEFYYDTQTDISEEDISVSSFTLSQNYPNPFNPSTTISYSIPQDSFVQLSVYDMLGQEVANLVSKDQSVGNYSVVFDASSLTSGVYFYKIQAGNFISTKKMILLR